MSSTPPEWIDVQIRCAVDAGELLGLLDDPDVQGAWQEGEAVHLYWPGLSWSPERLSRLQRALQQLGGEGQSLPEVLIESFPHQDWNLKWAESVEPLRIGQRIVIRPSWETIAVRPDQIEIVLDPKQAFGTGHHATTRMLLEWLEDMIAGGESVLDVGTGSGILAMAALKLGATRAIGIDNDPVAIECAQGYAEVNRFGEELSFRCGMLNSEEPFDLVLANLDRQTLLQLAEKLAGCTGTRLLVSGLLADQGQEVTDAFAQVGLYARDLRAREGWLALEFTRAQSCEGSGA